MSQTPEIDLDDDSTISDDQPSSGYTYAQIRYASMPLYKGTGRLGIILIVIGVIYFVLAVSSGAASVDRLSTFSQGTLSFSCFALIGIVFLERSNRSLRRKKRFAPYVEDGRDLPESLDDIAALVGKPTANVITDLDALIEDGFFPGSYVDCGKKRFVQSPASEHYLLDLSKLMVPNQENAESEMIPDEARDRELPDVSFLQRDLYFATNQGTRMLFVGGIVAAIGCIELVAAGLFATGFMQYETVTGVSSFLSFSILFLAIGISFYVRGYSKRRMYRRARFIDGLLRKEAMSFDELAEITATPQDEIVSDIAKTAKRNMLPSVSVDTETKTVIRPAEGEDIPDGFIMSIMKPQ